MTFPINPTEGQIHNNYMYDGTVGAWVNMGETLEDKIVSGGDDGEVIYLSRTNTSTNVILGTVPSGKVWYVFQYRLNRSEADVVAAEISLFTRNENDALQYIIYRSNHYSYGNDHVGSGGHLVVPVKLLAGWDLVAHNSNPGNGIYYHSGIWIWERSE